MTGRTSPAAVQNFIDLLQRVVSCVTESVVSVQGGYHPAVRPHRLTLGMGDYHSLAGTDLSLSVVMFYRILECPEKAGGWQVILSTYYYSFANQSLDEVLIYHYHPNQRSYVHYPHMHLEAGAQVGRKDVANAHLPTGWVTLTDVVRLAITELGVTPRRNDWQTILEEAQSLDGHLRPL